jgi:acetate---CoA ligase (ADP-forming)
LHSGQRPSGERAVLDYLAGFGVPVIPAKLAITAEQAVSIARELNGPVVLKIVSPDIQHKTEVGGVQLNVRGDTAVADGFDAMLARVRRAMPDARIDGVIVAPMREGGVELLVGTAHDPQWGPMIVVGLGGIWVEALRDTALRLLPVTRADVTEMLLSLRGIKLLQGFRGAPAADLDAIASAVVQIGQAALSLGPELAALEINPLRVSGSQVEALDALAIWKDDAT